MATTTKSVVLSKMQKLEFKLKQNKQTRYDLIVEIAGKLNKPIGQMLGLTAGISHQDLIKIMQSVEALSRDKGLPFSQSFFWHYNQIKKQL